MCLNELAELLNGMQWDERIGLIQHLRRDTLFVLLDVYADDGSDEYGDHCEPMTRQEVWDELVHRGAMEPSGLIVKTVKD